MKREYTPFAWLRVMLLAAGVGLTMGGMAQEEPAPELNGAPESVADEPRFERPQHTGEVVAIGGDATIPRGESANQVVVVRGTARIEGDVDGDVVVVLGTLTVTGRVDGNVVVVLGSAKIDGEILGDTALILSPASLGPRAVMSGDLLAVGDEPDIDPAASIARGPEIVSLGPLTRYLDWAKEYLFQGVFLLRPFPPRLGWVWIIAGLLLLFHVAIALLFPGPLRACMETLREQPARSFLVGLIACVLVGPVSLLLSFTMVATPLIWLAFFALCVFGRMAVYATAGAALGRAGKLSSMDHPVPALVLGSLLFYVSYMVPLIGFPIFWLVIPWGVGAVMLRLFEAMRRERRPSGNGGRTVPSYGSLAAASGLSSGTPGPATHALAEGTETARPSPAGEVPADAGFTAPPASPPPPLSSPPVVPIAPIDLGAAPRVGFWPRFGAVVIDLIVIGFVNLITFEQFKSFWLLVGAYHLVMWGWKATTLGGAVLGLRLIRLDGRPVDWATAAVRVLGSVVSLLPLGLGFFWVAWDDQMQSWHDRIAGTTIVKTERRMALV
jgi:uncharacterized RDD family membrane protein YckC